MQNVLVLPSHVHASKSVKEGLQGESTCLEMAMTIWPPPSRERCARRWSYETIYPVRNHATAV